MLEIIINNEALELEPESPLNLSLKSRIVYNDDQGSYSINYDIPRSPFNEKILRFANYTRVSNKTLSYDIVIKFSGITVHECTLIITDSGNNKSFSATILIDGIIAQLKEVNIKSDVDLGDDVDLADAGPSTGWEDGMAWYNEQVWDPDGSIAFCFPLINAPQWREQDETIALLFGDYIKVVNAGFGNVYDIEYGTSYVPCLYLMQVLKKSIEHLGWKLDGSFYRNTEMRQLALLNNYAIDGHDGATTFSDSESPLHAYTGANSGAPAPLDAGGGASPIYTITGAGIWLKVVITAKFHPYSELHKQFHLQTRKGISGPWAATQVIDLSNAYPSGYISHSFYCPITTAPDIGQGLFWTCWFDNGGTGIDDGSISDLTLRVYNMNEYSKIVVREDIELENHAPDVTISDLIKNTAKLFNLDVKFFPSKKKIELNFINSLFTAPKQIVNPEGVRKEYTINHEVKGGYSLQNKYQEGKEVTDINMFVFGSTHGTYREIDTADDLGPPSSVFRDLVWVKSSNEYMYNAIVNDGTSYSIEWLNYGAKDIPVVVGDGVNGISSDMAPARVTHFNRLETGIDRWYMMPMTSKKSINNDSEYSGDDVGLQIFFYRGLSNGISDSDGNDDSPFANTHIYDYEMNIQFTQSICMNADGGGLFELQFEKFINFLYEAEEVEMIQVMKASDLFSEPFDQWLIIEGRKYLLKERLVSIVTDKLKMSKIKLLKHG